MTSMTTQLVRKILEARAIQKGLIENEVILYDEKIDKFKEKSKPIIDAIEDFSPGKSKIFPGEKSKIFPSEESLIIPDPWVQRLYRQFRNQAKSKSTQFEINISNGVIGLKGQVDIPLLVNENLLRIKIMGRQDIFNDNLTPGLVALLLLPFDDLRRSNITPTEDDITNYVNIISLVGFSSINSKKYQAYIKTKLAAMPQDYRSRSTVASSESEEDLLEKRGKGIMFYQDPKELESKLMIKVGSLKSGNTSTELKEDIRSILDEMISVNYITLKQHRVLYNKLSLG